MKYDHRPLTDAVTTFSVQDGTIFGISKDHLPSGPPEHPPVPPVLDGYPPLPTVRATGAAGDPPVVPKVVPTEAPEEKDPWLWPVIILVTWILL